MTHRVTITIPIDPSQYADLGDSIEDACLVANEILYGAADVPSGENTIIYIGQSNEPIVTAMEKLLKAFISGNIKHEELPALINLSRITLLNLERNRQQTKVAKEI